MTVTLKINTRVKLKPRGKSSVTADTAEAAEAAAVAKAAAEVAVKAAAEAAKVTVKAAVARAAANVAVKAAAAVQEAAAATLQASALGRLARRWLLYQINLIRLRDPYLLFRMDVSSEDVSHTRSDGATKAVTPVTNYTIIPAPPPLLMPVTAFRPPPPPGKDDDCKTPAARHSFQERPLRIPPGHSSKIDDRYEKMRERDCGLNWGPELFLTDEDHTNIDPDVTHAFIEQKNKFFERCSNLESELEKMECIDLLGGELDVSADIKVWQDVAAELKKLEREAPRFSKVSSGVSDQEVKNIKADIGLSRLKRNCSLFLQRIQNGQDERIGLLGGELKILTDELQKFKRLNADICDLDVSSDYVEKFHGIEAVLTECHKGLDDLRQLIESKDKFFVECRVLRSRLQDLYSRTCTLSHSSSKPVYNLEDCDNDRKLYSARLQDLEEEAKQLNKFTYGESILSCIELNEYYSELDERIELLRRPSPVSITTSMFSHQTKKPTGPSGCDATYMQFVVDL